MTDYRHTSDRLRVARGSHHAWAMRSLAAGVNDAFRTTFDSLTWAVGDVRRRRELKQLVERVGPARSLTGAGDGEVRVEGRVYPVDPADRGVVARHQLTAIEGQCPCQRDCSAIVVRVRSALTLDRFLLRDADGLAIVEPGPFELLDAQGDVLDPFEAGDRTVSTGDTIVVIGEARREASALGGPALAGGYRESQLPLVFRGRPERPVRLFITRDHATGARASVAR